MKTRYKLKKLGVILLFLILALYLGMINVFSAPITKDEAVATANLWYAMELNSGYLKIDANERADRLSKLVNNNVLYLISKDDVLDSPPNMGDILAYIIKYDPNAFVIVSGEDRIEPIVVFSTDSEFRWDSPDLNFMRKFLGKNMVARWKYLNDSIAKGIKVDVHPNWAKLRSKLSENESLEKVSFKVTPEFYTLYTTALWGQGTYYNDEVLAHNGGIAGIPTGCTATAMAIKMRYHEWPNTGYGSHSYSDTWDAVQYSHSRNLGATTYNWSSMPTTTLTSTNSGVANLMYDCGVIVNMNYEVGGSGAWPSAGQTNFHFRYVGTEEKTTYHDNHVQASVKGGLPVVISSSAHTVVVDGYRDTASPYYHINAGWNGGSNGWYNLSNIPGGDPTVDRSYPYSSPSNYKYVDGVYRSSPDGTLQNAYQTISQGNTAVPAGGQLWIKGRTYTGAGNVPVTLSKQMVINTYEGGVTIGP